MTAKIKACPFCGSKAYADRSWIDHNPGVSCHTCSARVTAATVELAIAAWNRRAGGKREKE